MNILHTEWSRGWGGQEQRIILECCKVREMGHNVVLACQPGSGILRRAQEHGIPVQEVVMRGCIDPAAVWNLVRIIKRHRINIVNSHSGKDSWSAGFAAKLAGADLLVRTRHLALKLSNSPLNFIHKMADGTVTTGAMVRETMISHNGIDPDRIRSIPTGVSLDRFHPGVDGSGVREELGIAQGRPVVTMVAFMRRGNVKRHDVLIDAARILVRQFPGVLFLLVGDGEIRGEIERQIRELQLEENFLLAGHRDDVPQLLALSDLVVLTSELEGVPQALTQAMAMEKAVVAAPVGAIPDLVLDGKTGLFAESGNASSFAAAMARLLGDDRLRRELGVEARRHVLANFTDDTMMEAILSFYQYLLQKKNGLSAARACSFGA